MKRTKSDSPCIYNKTEQSSKNRLFSRLKCQPLQIQWLAEDRARRDTRCMWDGFSRFTNFESIIKSSCILANAACSASSKIYTSALFKFGVNYLNLFILAWTLPQFTFFRKVMRWIGICCSSYGEITLSLVVLDACSSRLT